MNKKRFALAIISIFTAINVSTVNAFAANFNDTSEHWASSSIVRAADSRYVDGYPDGDFKPDQGVTRAEFVKMLVTAMQIPYHAAEKNQDWYVPYFNALKDQGMFMGIEFEDYNQKLTREEMAYLSVRATDKSLQKKELMIDYKSTMHRATLSGLLQGKLFGDLDATGETTRAQSVTIIERVLKLRNSEQLEIDKYAASKAEVEMTGSNVGVMWGSKIKNLPMDLKADSPAKVELTGLLIIDMSDDNSPYRDWLPENSYVWSAKYYGNVQDYYMMAAKMKVTVTEGVSSDVMFSNPSSGFSTGSGLITVLPNAGSKLLPVPKTVWADGAQEVEGWKVYFVKKKFIDEIVDRGDKVRMFLSKQNSGIQYDLFE